MFFISAHVSQAYDFSTRLAAINAAAALVQEDDTLVSHDIHIVFEHPIPGKQRMWMVMFSLDNEPTCYLARK